MNDNLENQINLHSAGAIVRHKTPFENLVSYRNDTELTQEFVEKWVNPFYMRIGHYSDTGWIDEIFDISSEITEEVTLKLLGDFNWRTRLVGAYFSAVKNYQSQIDIIGVHFLKSEVCCVGHIYALILAFYNSEKTIQFLEKYLDYYLEKPELYFDQESALEAIVYLDKINNTKLFEKLEKRWFEMNLKRNELQKDRAIMVSGIIEKEQGKQASEKYLKEVLSAKNKIKSIDTEYIKTQIQIIQDLQKFCI
jgi:hypothetical protein